MAQYETRDGDTADEICWRYYQRAEAAVVEQVLAANPGLADRGPVLPAGVVVILPDLATPTKESGVRLWD